MHEIGVVRQVLKTVENFAEENGLEKIDTIVLEIGRPLAGHTKVC